jgi:16S rRNA (cytosine967-C5)-methyltransferase
MHRRDWLQRLIPRGGLDPEIARRAARPGGLRDALVAGYGAIRMDWRGARAAHGRVQRKARSLNSADRRFMTDALALLVRHDRTIALLCDRAGLGDASRRDRVELARVLAALTLGADLGADDVAETWLDREAIADPVHTLTGWLLETRPTDSQAYGVAASLPDHFARRLLSLDDPIELAAALNRRGPLCLRVNRPRATREEGLRLLAELGVEARPGELSADALLLERNIDVSGLAPVRDGLLEVQDEGSQLVAEVCAAQPGWRVVDACAGALGKSLALASAMQGKGSILAVDTRKQVLERGARRARRCGYTSIRPLPLERLGRPDGKADLVLVDAPCSGSGALRRRPWSRWAMPPQELAGLPAVQLSLLDRFAGFVRPGGRLVYATCSLFEEENEAVVDRFLTGRSGWRLAPLAAELPAARAERIGDGRVLKLYPHRHGTDGFFAAVLLRS